MPRLARDFTSFRRALQVSHVLVHILVEGREVDSYLYDRLAERSTREAVSYRIVRADELTDGRSGGKQLLLKLFQHLRHYKALMVTGRYAVLFVLDKDVDDIERRRRRSLHVLYTPSYDAECLLFRHGNLVEAVGAALSMQRSQLQFLRLSERWCDYAAERWLEWVALCLCARRLGANYPNYGSVSQVNDPSASQANLQKVREAIKNLANQSGKTSQQVEALYMRRVAKVRRLLRTGEIDRVFKGKWYADILTGDIMAMGLLPQRFQVGTLRAAVYTALMTTLDYDAPWGLWFRERFQTVVGSL